MERTLDVSADSMKWPEVERLATEACKLYDKKPHWSPDNASRYEEIAQLWSQLIGLDLAECRASPRVKGTVDLEETIHMILKVMVVATWVLGFEL